LERKTGARGRLSPENPTVERIPKLYDMQMALARMGGNSAILRQVIEMVREDIPEAMRRLHAAIAARNSVDVERAAHSLAGMVVTFDAEAALGAARRLQEIAQSGDLSQADAAVAALEHEISLLDQVLQAELQRP
jgi:HPt (histidine-containing phosphotransfer) domain-containing protein